MAKRWHVWIRPFEYPSRCAFCWTRQVLEIDPVGKEPYAECPHCGKLEFFDPEPLKL